MKKIKWLAAVAMVVAMSSQVQAQPARAGDFTLIDYEGNPHTLSKYRYQKAVVIISQANSCTMNQENVARYKVLRTNFNHRGVEFLMLNASVDDERDDVKQVNEVWNYDMPIMLDDTQLVAESLGITKASEIVVVDPRRMSILFRGPLDTPRAGGSPGTTDLWDTLDAAIASTDTRNVDVNVVEFEAAKGCDLEFPARDAHAQNVPDYETEIAPILIERCVGCHVEGGIGPFAMNSYQMIQGWSPMIREVLLTKRMPPAQVDPTIGHWVNARNLPIEETQKLIHWINAGSPRE